MQTSQNTYWNRNGKYEKEAVLLRTLITSEGPVVHARTRNKALEKFRQATYYYYDLYNNRLYNCNHIFRKFRKLFGRHPSAYLTLDNRFIDLFYIYVESAMDDIVMDAAIEQGIMKANLHVVV